MTSLAVAAATLALGFSGPAQDAPAAAPAAAPRSMVIGMADRLRVVGVPVFGSDEVCLCEIYEAEFEVLRTLEGPPVARRVKVRFIAHALRERQPNFIALMSVADDGEGLYAGDAWMGVTRDTCLVHDARGWSRAEPDERGRRPECTPVSTLVRPNRL